MIQLKLESYFDPSVKLILMETENLILKNL